MTVSCNCADFEKQIVLRAQRFRRILKVRFCRSIPWVNSFVAIGGFKANTWRNYWGYQCSKIETYTVPGKSTIASRLLRFCDQKHGPDLPKTRVPSVSEPTLVLLVSNIAPHKHYRKELRLLAEGRVFKSGALAARNFNSGHRFKNWGCCQRIILCVSPTALRHYQTDTHTDTVVHIFLPISKS